MYKNTKSTGSAITLLKQYILTTMRVFLTNKLKSFPPLIFVFVICWAMSSCTVAKKTPKILDEDVPNVHLAYQVEHVRIIDNRRHVSAAEMKIPAWSTPKSYTKHFPALTDEHRQEIALFCKNNLKGSGPSVQAIVNLVDGYKEFSATFSSERERAYVRMEVILYDTVTDTQLVSCESSAGFGVVSLDADQVKMEKIYQYTLRQAIYKCFKSIATDSSEE